MTAFRVLSERVRIQATTIEAAAYPMSTSAAKTSVKCTSPSANRNSARHL